MSELVPVLIEWIDSMAHHGWQEEVPKASDLRTTSVGLLVSEDDDCVVVALGRQHTGDTTWLCPMVIPRVSVTRLVQLSEGTEPSEGTDR